MALDPRYDISLEDPVSGEALGIMLDGPLSWASAQPMATRVVQAIDYKSFDEWSQVEQSSWHHGRGLEVWDEADPERFYDSYNVDTRIRDQFTLAPGQNVGQLGGEGWRYPGAGTLSSVHLVCDSSTTAGYFKKAAQGFQVSANGACTSITLRLWRSFQGTPGKYLTLRVETDSAGSPSGTLVHANATSTVATTTLTGPLQDVAFTFTSFNLVASTQYHLVLSHDDTTMTWVYWKCSSDTADRYALGGGKFMDAASGAWSANPVDGAYFDCFFTLPNWGDLNGSPYHFAQFNGKFYVGAGKAVYEWDNANGYWAASKTDFPNFISDLAVFAGVLWVAQNDGNLWTFDRASLTTTWTEKSNITATHLLVHKGYLYRSTFSTDNKVFYTADGTTWSTNAWLIGNPGRLERITGMTGYKYDVMVATTHGLYSLGPESGQGDLVDQIKDFASQYSVNNGKGLTTWAKTEQLFIPVSSALLSYTEGLLDSVGPDRDAGLPTTRQGTIMDLLSLTNWLVAAVDAGDSGTSCIMAYNGTGWHELARIPQFAKRPYALGYDTTVTPHRLWYGYGNVTGYITFPDVGDNPYQYTGSRYVSNGWLITPWINFGLLGTEKDFQSFGVYGECASGGAIEVKYEVDRSGQWTSLFSIDNDDMGNVYEYTFPFTPAYATNPTVAANSTVLTIEVGTNETSVMAAGHWVRINGEVRQVASVTDGNTFVLERPLSTVPAVGFKVYPARACGREIRFVFYLSTTSTSVTPLIKGCSLKAMPMLGDKLAGQFATTFFDGQKHYSDAEIPETAAYRAGLLHAFTRRPTPVDLYDRRGTVHRVKVTEVRETQERSTDTSGGGLPKIASAFQVSLVEV